MAPITAPTIAPVEGEEPEAASGLEEEEKVEVEVEVVASPRAAAVVSPDAVAVAVAVVDDPSRSEAFQLIWTMGAHARRVEVLAVAVAASTYGSVRSPPVRTLSEQIAVVTVVDEARRKHVWPDSLTRLVQA